MRSLSTDGWWHPVGALVRLKWAILLGSARGSIRTRVQFLVSLAVSLLLGGVAIVMLIGLGSADEISGDVLIVVLAASSFGVALLAAAAGVEGTLDPRLLSSEPISSSQLAIGLLAGAVLGPSGLLAALSGVGVFLGWRSGAAGSDLILAVTVVAWWVTLLLLSRTTANLLGAMATGRFRIIAQAMAPGAALLAWFFANLVSSNQDKWNADGLRTVAGVLSYTPAGQLGVAVRASGRSVIVALVLGLSWLPLLLWSTVVSTRKLITVAPVLHSDSPRRSRGKVIWNAISSLPGLGQGPIGTVARRSLITKIRTPRQAVNTVTSLAVGGGVMVLAPVLDGGLRDPRAVLMGGMLQFVVLFDGNNAFGFDGPALWAEVQAGANGRTLVWSKVLASVYTVGPFAVALPVTLAAIGNGWQWLPAALLLAAGSVASAAGVAVLSASWTPVSIPPSANVLASGDPGQGCLASITLFVGILSLVIITGPLVVLLYLVSSSSTIVSTVLAVPFLALGLTVMGFGVRIASRRLVSNEVRLVELVTPRR